MQLHRLEPHPQTQKVGKAVTEEEFKSLLERLNDKEGWPLGLEAVRQATLKRLKKVQDDMGAWAKRASFELDKGPVFQSGGKGGGPKWICSKDHLQHDTRALQTLLSQAAVFPCLPQKVHASVEATSHALQWALQCLEVSDVGAPFVVRMEQLQDLVPRDGQASIGHVTDKAALKRIKTLLEFMFALASKASAWEGAVNRALKGGKDRKIGRPQLAALEQEYAKTRVKDEEKAAKVQELADNIRTWEERAARAMVSRGTRVQGEGRVVYTVAAKGFRNADSRCVLVEQESKDREELTVLQEEADDALKNHKLEGREGVSPPHTLTFPSPCTRLFLPSR